MKPEQLLNPRHPDQSCHEAQLDLLAQQQDVVERARLAQLLRWGNATYRYYNENHIEATETDYQEWLQGLPARPQAALRALGFEENRLSLPLRRYVLEKRDIGMSDFLKVMLSADDWLAYQQTTALNAWQPPVE